MATGSENTIDITAAIDDGPISRLLVQAGILCAVVAVLVGLDTSSINVAAPLIARGLGLSQAHLGPIFSAALFGSMVGALSFGSLADRIGRKRVLVLATLTFGLFTFATAIAGSFRALLLARFLAGIGLGGAIPCLITLASEYAPRAHRAMVTSLIWTGFPTGVISGSFLNAFLLRHFGWQAIFLVGGVFPVMAAAALLVWLPESIRFLLVRRPDAARIRRIAVRIVPSLPADAAIVAREERLEGTPIRNLFRHGRATETVVLWVSSLAVFGTGLGVFFWVPTLLAGHGIPLSRAATLLGFSGIGALIGSAVAGRLIERFGPTAVLAPTFVLGALATAALGRAAGSPVGLAIDLLMTGSLIGGLGSSGVLALTSRVYPTAMRSTGLGWAAGMGRLGEMLGPLLTGALISIGWTLDQVFVVTASALTLAALCVLFLGWRVAHPRLGAPTAARRGVRS